VKPGHVAKVKLTDIIETQTSNGPNFTPVFELAGLVPRPADLPAPQKGDPRKPVKPTRTGGIKVASMDEEGPPF
jgi:hypothetical protein